MYKVNVRVLLAAVEAVFGEEGEDHTLLRMYEISQRFKNQKYVERLGRSKSAIEYSDAIFKETNLTDADEIELQLMYAKAAWTYHSMLPV